MSTTDDWRLTVRPGTYRTLGGLLKARIDLDLLLTLTRGLPSLSSSVPLYIIHRIVAHRGYLLVLFRGRRHAGLGLRRGVGTAARA